MGYVKDFFFYDMDLEPEREETSGVNQNGRMIKNEKSLSLSENDKDSDFSCSKEDLIQKIRMEEKRNSSFLNQDGYLYEHDYTYTNESIRPKQEKNKNGVFLFLAQLTCSLLLFVGFLLTKMKFIDFLNIFPYTKLLTLK